jgi:arginase
MPVPIVLIEAPSILGLAPTGVEDLPRALRAAGLDERLGVPRSMLVPPPDYDPRRASDTAFLNAESLAAYTRDLAAAVGATLDEGGWPLVLGGDCSILLGNLLALARRGRHGLLFLDGHADFYQPAANVHGQAASSELALATGRGPAGVTTFDGICPLIEDERVATIGTRDFDQARFYGSQTLPPGISCFDADTIHRDGAAAVVARTMERFTSQGLDGLWLHLDVDVLDDELMPAVDYHLPGGLRWEELETLLGAALSSAAIVGLDITIFNPRLDADGRLARSIVDLLGRLLGPPHDSD